MVTTALSKLHLACHPQDVPHSSIYSSTNEKLDRSNFIEGVCLTPSTNDPMINVRILSQSKLIGTYLYEVAAINS